MARSGTIARLREKCSALREQLVEGGTATAVEIAEVWPGGLSNPRRDLWSWVVCHAKLHAICARIALKMERGQENNEERKAAVLAALLDTPETVQLAGLDHDGEPRQITVYPKSAVALGEVNDRNLTLASLIDSAAVLEQYGDTAADVDLLRRCYAEQSYLQRVMIWIATHPGPGLPFPEYAAAPVPPAELDELHPADFYAISAAFQRVNVKRLTLLDATRSNETRPDWSIVLASLAGSMNRSAADVMRDTSLASFLSQASERSRGFEQAQKAAEQKQSKRKVA